MKLTSDNETLAENKVLILYILNIIDKPVSNDELLHLVLSIEDMNYFYFQQFLLDLLEDHFIEQFEKDEATLYQLTTEGKNTLDLTIDIIPGILKLKVDSQFKENLTKEKEKKEIKETLTPKQKKLKELNYHLGIFALF